MSSQQNWLKINGNLILLIDLVMIKLASFYFNWVNLRFWTISFKLIGLKRKKSSKSWEWHEKLILTKAIINVIVFAGYLTLLSCFDDRMKSFEKNSSNGKQCTALLWLKLLPSNEAFKSNDFWQWKNNSIFE